MILKATLIIRIKPQNDTESDFSFIVDSRSTKIL